MTIASDHRRLEGDLFRHATVGELSFAVAGLGALGSEVVRLLGQLGARAVLLVDPDVLGPENLPFNVLYRWADPAHVHGSVPAFKSDRIIETCRMLFPDTGWSSYPVEIADVGLAALARCDLIFSCTDNALARAECAYIARRLGKPMADGGLEGEGSRSGRVSWFPPEGEHACYLCQLSEARRAELLSLAQATSMGCATGLEPVPMTSTPSMASLIGGALVELGLQQLLCSDEPVEKGAHAWVFDLSLAHSRMENLHIPRSATCPWHPVSHFGNSVTSVRLAYETPFADLLRVNDPVGEFELDWPMCILARCLACEYRWVPAMRLALLRRKGRCPQCGSGAVDPLQSVERISAASAHAALTPRELGLPPEHMCFLYRSGDNPAHAVRETRP